MNSLLEYPIIFIFLFSCLLTFIFIIFVLTITYSFTVLTEPCSAHLSSSASPGWVDILADKDSHRRGSTSDHPPDTDTTAYGPSPRCPRSYRIPEQTDITEIIT